VAEDWKAKYSEAARDADQAERALVRAESVLRYAVNRLSALWAEAHPTLAGDLDELKAEVADEPDWAAVDQRLRQLTEATRQLEAEPHDEETHPADDRLSLAASALRTLIEYVDLPEASRHMASGLVIELDRLRDEDQLFAVVLDSAKLMNGLRRNARDEQDELTQFVQQLAESLAELEAMMANLQSEQNAAESSHSQIRERVAANVVQLNHAISVAEDLPRLRRDVLLHVDNLKESLEEMRRGDERRVRLLEVEAAQLRERVGSLEAETGTLHRNLQEAKARMLRDPLTGLPNRMALDEYLEQAFSQWQRYGHPLSLVVWDIDHFKRVNDSFGHKAGDKALRVVARELLAHVRKSDFMARFGGEEFVMLMPETDAEQALAVANKLRERVEQAPFRYNQQPLKITVSGGVTEYRSGDDSESAFVRADEALYEAKHNGRNQCVLR